MRIVVYDTRNGLYYIKDCDDATSASEKYLKWRIKRKGETGLNVD